MLKKNRKLLVIAMVVVLAFGAFAAYFTSTDTATNTWTVGQVKIDLVEPEYDESDTEDITPNQELPKDPQIVNEGVNDAFVFIKVEIPKADVIVADQDGTKGAKAVQELFAYEWDDAWTLVDSDTSGANSNTYILAYGGDDACTALANGNTTTPVFKDGKITFVNVIEGQDLELSTLTIPVEAYAIQTTDLTAADVKAPADVWDIVSTQTPVATEDYVDFN